MRCRFSCYATSATVIYTLSLHDALPISGRAPGAGRADAEGSEIPGARRQLRRPVAAAPEPPQPRAHRPGRSEEHTSELQSPCNLVCRLLLEKKKKNV